MQEEYLREAHKYQLLADYYKYNNPDLHVKNYYKHLEYMQKALQSPRYQQVTGLQLEDTAKVRVLHAIPNAPNVDVLVNGTRILQDFPYKKVSNYLSLPPGSYQIDIYPTGKLVSTIASKKISVDKNKFYTVAAAGTATNGRILQFKDNPNPPQGESMVRFMHLIPNGPAVDIAVKQGEVIFPNVNFKQATDYLGLTPMTLSFEVRPTGTDEVLLVVTDIMFKPNRSYTIIAIGLPDGTVPVEAIVIK